MQVLAKLSVGVVLGFMILGLISCYNRGSSEYEHIEDLPHPEWENYARTLPLEQRLDLHKEIMERSGHNPLMTISGAFNNQTERTYRLIVDRLVAGDRSRHYVRVLYEINRQDDFEICDQPDREIVQTYLWDLATDAVPPDRRPDFYRC